MMTPAETNLVRLFETAGYARADAALLQPADIFIDLSGEDIRRRLYLTQDGEGNDMCLRPEFTIPLCRAAVDGGQPIAASLSYFGPVFRHRPGESGEFHQAGVESLGRRDTAAADAEMLALALDAAHALGHAKPRLRLGDVGLLDSMLMALGASASYSRRLKRRLSAGTPALPRPAGHASPAGLDRYAGVLAALEGAGPEAAQAFVGDMLNMAGIQVAGGRSVSEIAARFLAKSGNADSNLPADRQATLDLFLAAEGDPDALAEKLRDLARDAKADIGAALDAYETRTGFLAARGVDVSAIQAQARFVRSLDYYTGMTFEISDPSLAGGKPLVGGGRYDNLLGKLGATLPAPAVGFSIWVERFGSITPGGAA
jgi:ATP phosphoribosyltransferase regulatory subunit